MERVTGRAVVDSDRSSRKDAEALRARGVERYAAGDLEAAAALWREALALLPDDIQAQAYVAWVESRIAIEAPGVGRPRPERPVPASVFSADTVDPIAALPEETQLASPEITLTWYPSEFTKVRLQYNYDNRKNVGIDHSIWLQFEFLLGSHGAHKF